MRSTHPITSALATLLFVLLGLTSADVHALSDSEARQFFPTATHVGSRDDELPLWPVFQVTQLLGYVFDSADLVHIPAFSGEPVDLRIGLSSAGLLTDVQLLRQREPIFLHGLGPAPLLEFLQQYRQRSIKQALRVHSSGHPADAQSLDGISRATVSVIAINETVLLSALKVARHKLSGFNQPSLALARSDLYQPLTLEALRERGWLRSLQLDFGDIDPQLALSQQGAAQQALIDMQFAYLNAPSIGRNLLGEQDYRRLMAALNPGEHAIAVLSRGDYSFVGEDFVRNAAPSRIALLQQDLPIAIRDMDFYDLVAIGNPELAAFDSIKIFRIKAQSEFNPAAAWQLQLLIEEQRGPLFAPRSDRDRADYQLPPALFIIEAPRRSATTSLWARIWQQRLGEITLLAATLLLISAVFLRQHQLARQLQYPRHWRSLYLLFMLAFIGFYSQGQLSLVNVFTLLQTTLHGFRLSDFLLDPIIFILWIYVCISLLLWGRGVFCGWLCPFGALQELLTQIARAAQIRPLRLRRQLHRKLLWLKYAILVTLSALSLFALDAAMRAAEVEPFKTAITLGFMREWPFLLYCLALLLIGLWIPKFYCRYLCALGAGLALLGRARRFAWIRRYPACGKPCQLCRHRCDVDAIAPDGRIDYDECVQCLDCVMIYHDRNQCAVQKLAGRRAASAPEPIRLSTPSR